MSIDRNARPPALHALKPLPVEVKPVPVYVDDEDIRARKNRAGGRHARRLHMARMGERHLPWRRQVEEEPRCAECGTERSNTTLGCETCHMRQAKREKRAGLTEAERDAVRAADRERKQRTRG